LHNGGWTLFFNYVNQGNGKILNKFPDPKAGHTDETMFPQHILDPTMRNGGEKWIPIENKHMPLNKIMPEENEIENYNVIKKLWFFCSVFTINEDNTFNVEHMQSFTTDMQGVIKTAFTEDRSTVEDMWLAESQDLPPNAIAFGDMNDDDDTPSFYLLDKFKPAAMFDSSRGPKLANLFRTAGDPAKMVTNKSTLRTEGFHNTLFTATAEAEPKDLSYKWSVKTVESPPEEDPKNENDGI